MARRGFEQRGGIGDPDEVHGSAGLPRTERDRPPGHVEQREHADGAAAARGAGRADERPQPVGAVRQHDALRAAGAAAGEEDDVRIPLVEVHVGPRPRALDVVRPLEAVGDAEAVGELPGAIGTHRHPHRHPNRARPSPAPVPRPGAPLRATPARSAARTPRRPSRRPRRSGSPPVTCQPRTTRDRPDRSRCGACRARCSWRPVRCRRR